MNWWQHSTGLRRDPSITNLLDNAKHKIEAYGFVCALIEAIAETWDGADGEPSQEHSLQGWAAVLGCHRHLVRTYLGTSHEPEGIIAHTHGGTLDIRARWSEGKCKVTIDSLAKWRDESARKKARALTRIPETVRNDSGLNPARGEEKRGDVDQRRGQDRRSGSASSGSHRSSTFKVSPTGHDATAEADFIRRANALEPMPSEKTEMLWRKTYQRCEMRGLIHDMYEALHHAEMTQDPVQRRTKDIGELDNPAQWLNGQLRKLLGAGTECTTTAN